MGQQACCSSDNSAAKDVEYASDQEGGKRAARFSNKPNAPPPMAAPKSNSEESETTAYSSEEESDEDIEDAADLDKEVQRKFVEECTSFHKRLDQEIMNTQLNQVPAPTILPASYVPRPPGLTELLLTGVSAPVAAYPQVAPQSIVVEFKDNAGVQYTKAITKKPLGMTFDKKFRVVVQEVEEGSVAAELGIKVGWEFKAIAGVPLEGKDFGECLSLIQEGLQSLPAR
mmetsp:Transcript_39559/g.62844  ORF Transcript_39559/g.62844 Transcript_39559/m.62844 type:complete len:228 (-) Transcript_39559:7-690(-)